MPVSNPPTHVPWFPKGDPLLPENRDVEVKPLLRLFDPYQTYDALIFSTVNRQLPLGKLEIKGQLVNEEKGISSGLADPFSAATLHENLKSGHYFLLVERFTPSNSPFADEYVDRLKEIGDHFLTLPIKGEFEGKELNQDPIPPAIEVEDDQPEADTATVTWFYKDGNDLNKREITVRSYEGTLFSWRLSLTDDQPLICPYSVVVTSETGYLQQLLSGEIKNQCPYLLYQDVDDFVQFFKNNFQFNNSDIDDPYRIKELYLEEYTEERHQKFRKIEKTEYKQKEDKIGLVKRTKWLGTDYTNLLSEEFRLKGATSNFHFQKAHSELQQKLQFLGIDISASPQISSFSLPTRNPKRVSPIGDPSRSGPVVNYVTHNLSYNGDAEDLEYANEDAFNEGDEEPKIGQIVSNRINLGITQAPRVIEGLPIETFEVVRRGFVIYDSIWKICNVKSVEQISYEEEITLDFDKESKDIRNWLEDFGIEEEAYNFASIVRANAYSTKFTDTKPNLYVYRSATSNLEKNGVFPLGTDKLAIAKGSYEEGLPVPFFNLDEPFFSTVPNKEKDTITDINEKEEETKTFIVTKNPPKSSSQDCGTDEEKDFVTKLTKTDELKWKQTFTWNAGKYFPVKPENLIPVIDRSHWEWEIKEGTYELTEDMPDSIRIKEIHKALDADRYASYQTSDGEDSQGRLDNLGFYIETMGRLLGINVMPDRSKYKPKQLEKITPDEEGNIEVPPEYNQSSWGESFEVPGEERVDNPDFARYGKQFNGFAYEVISKDFGEDPNTGEQTRLQEGGFYLCHNIPQLIQAILSDLGQAIDWEELGASQGNIEKAIRSFYKKQFVKDYDPDDEEWENWEDNDDELESGEARLYPKQVQAKGLVELLGAYLAIPYARAGYQEYPAEVPESLLSSDPNAEDEQSEPIQIGSSSKFFEWYIRQFDGIVGQFPMKIKVEDNDLVHTDGDPIEIELPNIAETLAEIYGYHITNQAKVGTLLSSNLKELSEIGSTRILSIKNNSLLMAIMEYLGFGVEQNFEDVPFTFDVEGTLPSKKNNNKGDERLSTALKRAKMTIETVKNNDSETLEDQLAVLLEAARMYKGQNFQPIDINKNPKGQLLDILKNASEIIKQQQPEDEKDFSQWLDKVEEEFSNAPRKSNPDKPYGKDFSRRPKIRDINDQGND